MGQQASLNRDLSVVFRQANLCLGRYRNPTHYSNLSAVDAQDAWPIGQSTEQVDERSAIN